jgi:phosphatidate cytidylyltransferase
VLRRRLISAFIIISVMLLLLGLDYWLGTEPMLGRPGLVLCLLAILTAASAAGEFVQMWQKSPGKPAMNVILVATIAMVMVTCAPVCWRDYPPDCPIGQFGWSFSGIILALVITFIWEMRCFGNSESTSHEVTDRIGRAALFLAYLGMLFGFLVPHRLLQDDNSLGLISIITLIATVKLSDSFAYFVGKSIGTIRLAPKLSPGKTLQGSAGALLGGCVAAAICVFLVSPLIFGTTIAKPWWWFLVYGLLVTLAGMFGDLAESLLKRDADCKDSSSWIPGMGGVLDVIDSLIFAAPVSYFLWIIANTS